MESPAHRTLGLTVPVAEALNPKKWRERYAFGLTLGEGDPPSEAGALARILGCGGSRGAPKTAGALALQNALAERVTQLTDDVIRWHLRVCMSELEVKLGIPLGTVVVKGDPVESGLVQGQDYDKLEPRRPFSPSGQQNFYRIDLPAGVISVERVRAYWYGLLIWSISDADHNGEMLQFEHPGTSSLHILPTTGSTLLVVAPTVGSPVYGAMQLVSGFPENLPGVWSIDYTMGPRTKYSGVPEIEAVLAHWVGCKAAVTLLSLAGQSQAKGISNASLSIDGISKSVALTNSVMYGINSALEIRYKEAHEAIDWKMLRTYKRGLRIRPYGGA